MMKEQVLKALESLIEDLRNDNAEIVTFSSVTKVEDKLIHKGLAKRKRTELNIITKPPGYDPYEE